MLMLDSVRATISLDFFFRIKSYTFLEDVITPEIYLKCQIGLTVEDVLKDFV